MHRNRFLIAARSAAELADLPKAVAQSQAHAGWTLIRAKYDDGGFSGGNTDRPALQRLLDDIRAGKMM